MRILYSFVIRYLSVESAMHPQVRSYLKKCPPLYHVAKWGYANLRDIKAARKWKALCLQENIKLELGSGAKHGVDGWTTVDLALADINYDLCNGIPLKDASVDAIYTSHMLEHLYFPELIHLLGECHRVLKPGGYLSVCVPNAAHYIRAYSEGREFEPLEKQFADAVTATGSRLDQVNYIAFMGGAHKYMFDEENLPNTLKRGGFPRAELRSFDPAVDAEKFRYVSIYATAHK